MKQPQELTAWDFPDQLQVPDGYDMKSIPDLTRRNLEFLIEEHNKLVEFVSYMADKVNFVLDE